MKTFKKIIQVLILILLYLIFYRLLKESIRIECLVNSIFAIIISITTLIILHFDTKKADIRINNNEKELFNTYYINYPKVYEIVMLINNKIKINSEELLKRQKEFKKNYSIEGKYLSLIGKIGQSKNEVTNHEYKEIQEIKNTNSTFLREVLKKCKKVNKLENLNNGDLVKIDNVKLNILNNREILEANSIISGAFNGNTLDTYSEGQTFKININSLTNMILKDYKYNIIATKENEKFYIDIPMKAEKEFENEYSIYDLEIGLVNIIGIYRTDSYNPNNKTTYSKLQELGNKENIEIHEMKSSSDSEENIKDAIKLESAPYIDLIAIIQDLSFENGDNEKNG